MGTKELKDDKGHETELRSSPGNHPSEHTPGPWRTRDGLVFFPGSAGGFSLQNCPVAHANARRIVAAVNACEGISTEQLEATHGLDALYGEMQAERDRLRERVAQLEQTLQQIQILPDYAQASAAKHLADAVLAKVRS